jgi:geranylgeranyl diphosphate synthase type II
MKRLSRNPKAEDILDYYKERVWPIIQTSIHDPKYPYHFRIPSKYRKERKYHWSTVAEYPKRKGKYLRPTLLILTAEAMGLNRNKALLGIAAAMQVSEEWILIHDDIQDNSVLRRGDLALHRRHSSEIAINSGDVLHILMWKILLNQKDYLRNKTFNRLYEEFYTMLTRTAIGQTVEVKWTQENKNHFDDNDWFFIADSKSAYYYIRKCKCQTVT